MRLAAIDIGTNSVHMIVVRVRPDLSFEVIDREKEMVRLGAGGLDGRKLTAEAMDAALQALSKFKRLAESHRVDEILAAATSATREARNGGEFLARIEAETGIRPRVITGAEEARLIHLAAVYGVDVSARGRRHRHRRRQRRDHARHGDEAAAGAQLQDRRDPADRAVRQERPAQRARRAEAGQAHPRRDRSRTAKQIVRVGFDRVIGTSGTILSLGHVAAHEMLGQEPDELRNLRVPAKQIRRAAQEGARHCRSSSGCACPASIRAAPTSSSPARCCSTRSCAGSAPRRSRCAIWRCAKGWCSTTSAATARRSRRSIASPTCGAAARSSWPSAATTGRSTPSRSSRLSLALFDQTRGVHGLTDREREWLEYAALLHDIGVHISYERHHRHSYYLIKNGDLRGFDPDEIEVMALVARYHRRGTPKKGHAGYSESAAGAAQDRQGAGRLPAGGRKPRPQPRAGHRSVELQDRGDDVLLQLHTTGDAELEVWAASRHVEPFEELVGKPVRLEVAPARGQKRTGRRARRRAADAPASRHAA